MRKAADQAAPVVRTVLESVLTMDLHEPEVNVPGRRRIVKDDGYQRDLPLNEVTIDDLPGEEDSPERHSTAQRTSERHSTAQSYDSEDQRAPLYCSEDSIDARSVLTPAPTDEATKIDDTAVKAARSISDALMASENMSALIETQALVECTNEDGAELDDEDRSEFAAPTAPPWLPEAEATAAIAAPLGPPPTRVQRAGTCPTDRPPPIATADTADWDAIDTIDTADAGTCVAEAAAATPPQAPLLDAQGTVSDAAVVAAAEEPLQSSPT